LLFFPRSLEYRIPESFNPPASCSLAKLFNHLMQTRDFPSNLHKAELPSRHHVQIESTSMVSREHLQRTDYSTSRLCRVQVPRFFPKTNFSTLLILLLEIIFPGGRRSSRFIPSTSGASQFPLLLRTKEVSLRGRLKGSSNALKPYT
jgi:hypothetical protein